MAEPGTPGGDATNFVPPGESAAPQPENSNGSSGSGDHKVSSAAIEDLKLEFNRLKLHFKPLLESAKDFAQSEARLRVFETKENARLAGMRLMLVAFAAVFGVTAWILFSVFVYQLTRDVAPGLPWLAPLVVAAIHLAIAGAALSYTKKLRL